MHFSSSVTVLQRACQQHFGPCVSCSYGSSNALQAFTAECTWQTVSCPHTEKCPISQQSLGFTHWSPPQM